MNDIQNLKSEAISQILEAKDGAELERIRINYLGRNGKVTQIIKRIKKLNPAERKKTGLLANEIKNILTEQIAGRKNQLKTDVRKWLDPTVPGIKPKIGRLHLVTQAIEEITGIFKQIGFIRRRYPEVEWDWYAFGSLNFPIDHPARDEWETYFIDTKPHPSYGPMLLTPHTSSGQVREMKRVGKPPIRMMNISKCYRRQSDASHYPMFHQFEGLAIDQNINITHLKGTIDYFAQCFYGGQTKTRIRPYHFQFTEPSFEVDISCVICSGKGCRVCGDGWLELGGAGMVHPSVLQAGKINPHKYKGFAFGFGVERVLMMKPSLSIPDLRQLYSTDLRYLRQF